MYAHPEALDESHTEQFVTIAPNLAIMNIYIMCLRLRTCAT